MSEQVRALVNGLGANVESGSQVLSELVRRSSALVVQEPLEAEQRDFIGPEWYEHGARCGYRSGYVPGHLDTGEGWLMVERPQVRGAEEPFRSILYDYLRSHSEEVERLTVEMYAAGCRRATSRRRSPMPTGRVCCLERR